MATYDDANNIIGRAFPSMATANDIVGRAFPSMAAGDRILAGAGFIPRGGRGRGVLPPKSSMPGARGPRPGAVSGPHRTGGRSPAAKIIGDDAAVGGTVDIRVWAAKLKAAGISGDDIFAAYNAAGGDAVLAPAEATGTNADDIEFLGDFVEALEATGADPKVILGAYQQAGGLRG